MKLACGVGRRFQKVRGSPRLAATAGGADSRSKTWVNWWGVIPPSRRRRGERDILPEAAETARTSRAASNSLWSACEREREQAAVGQGLILRGKRLFRLGGARDALWAIS